MKCAETEMENPLLNHLVVKKVLSLACPNFHELKHLRLVHPLWYTVSLDTWRKSVFLRLKQNYDDDENSPGVSLGQFCKHCQTDENNNDILELVRKPYRNYKLNDWFPRPYRNLEKIEMEKCQWNQIIAPIIKYLNVENCYWSDSTLLEQMLLACKNLEELTLDNNSYGCCRMRMIDSIKLEISQLTKLKTLTVCGGMPLQWSNLLMHTPNLESLTIKQNEKYERTTFASFLLDLHELEFAGRNPQDLKHLDIMEADVTFLDFVSLSARNLQLESLSIQFENVRPEHFLKPLLEAQARTLKVLKICRVSNRAEGPFNHMEFPYGVYMPKVTELYIWGHIVNSLEFLRYFPNLKKLFISRDTFEKRHLLKIWGTGESLESIPEDLLSDQNIVIPNNTIIEVLHVDSKFSADSLKRLKGCMPGLTTLETVVTNETMHLVCNLWPDIKELKCLHGSVIDDNGVKPCLMLKGIEKLQVETFCNQSKISLNALLLQNKYYIPKSLKLLELSITNQETMAAQTEIKNLNPQCHVKLMPNYSPHCNSEACTCHERKRYIVFKD